MINDDARVAITHFTGIDRSADQTLMPIESCYMAENMDTDDGNLAVAKGFSKFIDEPVPTEKKITRLMRLRRDNGFDVYVVCENEIFGYDVATKAWKSIKEFTDGIVGNRWDYVDVRMTVSSAKKEALIIANGEYPPIKIIDNVATDLGTKHPKVNYLTLHANRLFSSGNTASPSSVYYSKTFAYDDWASATTGVSGGEIIVGSDIADNVTALKTIGNGLFIAKRESAYRISGTDDTNFYNRKVIGRIDSIAHTAVTEYLDAGYMLTQKGILRYDTSAVYAFKESAKIDLVIQKSKVNNCVAAATLEKLFFTLKLEDGRDAILEYNAKNKTFMLRTGFSVIDAFVHDDELYFIGDKRYVYKFDDSATYDGEQINAYWQTNFNDFGSKNIIKSYVNLYMYVEGDEGGKLFVESATERNAYKTYRLVGKVGSPIMYRPRLKSYGRRVRLKIFNEAGKYFKIYSGLEIGIELDED